MSVLKGGVILQSPLASIMSIEKTKKDRGRLKSMASIITADMVYFLPSLD